MATTFEHSYDYEEPEVAKESIAAEPHTIPNSSPYEIFLLHIPREADGVTITGFTEVVSSPSAGEFRVYYGASGRGRVEFNSADAGTDIEAAYEACGSVVWAETYTDGREGINKVREAINAAENSIETIPWVLVDEFTNTGTSTVIDHDTGALDRYDVYRCLFMIENTAGGSIWIRMQVNGYSTGYAWRNNSGTYSTGQAAWDLVPTLASNREAIGELFFRGNNFAGGTAQYINVAARIAADDVTGALMLWGNCRNDEGTGLNRWRIFTNDWAIGRFIVLGANF